MEEDKWDKEKLEKAMGESKEEFMELQRRLARLMADYGTRALKTLQAAKSEPLNPVQIIDIVTKEIKAVIKTLSAPSFVDMIIQRAGMNFTDDNIEVNKA